MNGAEISLKMSGSACTNTARDIPISNVQRAIDRVKPALESKNALGVFRQAPGSFQTSHWEGSDKWHPRKPITGKA